MPLPSVPSILRERLNSCMNDFQTALTESILKLTNPRQDSPIQAIEVVFLGFSRDTVPRGITKDAVVSNRVQVLEVDAQECRLSLIQKILLGGILDERFVVSVFERIRMGRIKITIVHDGELWGGNGAGRRGCVCRR